MRKRTHLLLVIIAVFGVIGAACSSAVDLAATPDIRVGEDICDECGMIISEEVYSSAYRLSDGEQKSFDDIGDMVAHYRLHDDEVAAFWVHDFNSVEWIRAENAFFVASYDLVTPMGHGIAAFTDRTAAQALAADLNGAVHTLDDLLAQSIGELPRHADEETETLHDGEVENEPGVFDIFTQSPRDPVGI